MITTFEDEPYRAPFSGNVIELCPVGALTSTQYRFEARPWEIQNVPTVCGLCPVGCNITATTREGKVKRILSRNHPEVDQGWLCDKGRFAYPHLYADDRIVDPLERVRRRGFTELSWDDALDRAEALLRGAEGRIVTALSGSETVEQAYALGKLLAPGLGAHSAVLPEATSLGARRLPRAALGDRARGARRRDRRGARSPTAPRSSSSGSSRRAATAPRSSSWRSRSSAPSSSSGCVRSDRAVLIWSGRAGGGGARLAELAHRSASRASPAAPPSTCPRRRTAAASPTPGPRPRTGTRRTRSRSAS